MRTPEIFLAHAPRGCGLRCALAYLSDERDVYGWFTGPRTDGSVASAFFLIGDYFANRPASYESVTQGDLHSDWGLDEARRHELARLQDAFVREWLQENAVPAGWTGPQVREDRLAKFWKLQPNWTYYSTGFVHGVLRFLARRWPLDYRAENSAATEPRRRAAGPRP